jgi:hypothetical protein
VRADLPGGQALGIQRQHDLIDPGQPPLPLLDDLRLERALPVAGTSIGTCPLAWVSTVLGLAPFRTFPASLPAGPCLS